MQASPRRVDLSSAISSTSKFETPTSANLPAGSKKLHRFRRFAQTEYRRANEAGRGRSVDAKRLRLLSQARGRLCPRRVVRISLADDEGALSVALDGLGNDSFGAAFTVHFRGIDQGHPEIDPELQRTHLQSALVAPSPMRQVPNRVQERFRRRVA